MDHLRKDGVRLSILAGLVFNSLVWIVVLLPNDSYKDHLLVKRMNTYTAFYMLDSSSLVLYDHKPRYTTVHLGAEESRAVANFTNACILCNSREPCGYEGTDFGVSLSVAYDIRLGVSGFERCRVPTSCYWFNREFDCNDLEMISKLI